MTLKIASNITRNYSINFDLPKRNKRLIKFVIIHYTGMKKESEAIKRLCNYKSKVSSHYFIKNNGIVLNLVPDLYKAWHAGKSSWKNFKSLNKYSIGIEINNPGHDYKYKNLCFWHNLDEKRLKKLRNFKLNYYEEKIFFKNLYHIGYSKINEPNLKRSKINLIRSFQRRFRQNLINGKIDKECLLISKSLVET